ncbi:chlorite dismutase family protein [Corynebacterium propinquum]|uniref:Coproheme decarboxylase n=1 Tax=Corynebacterium propinquum TaxID=43769 RepID=A0AAP4F9I3_9CORY|nr:hydrogen peroxide-dependent heme synthase [Corynebacterium propinquum]MDK4325343.1 chlorite dismutase family protein [Corynebacterium propinquum]
MAASHSESPQELNCDELNKVQRYSQHAVFKLNDGFTAGDKASRERMAVEAQEFFDRLADEGRITVRGIYDLAGMKANADFMIWWHAETFEEVQSAFAAFRRETSLGKASSLVWAGNGVHRPSEFNKRHLPAFIMGEAPEKWCCVYPFIRSYDWYVMEEEKRARILREHGMKARDFADVRANTIAAFVVSDYEWMLSFEAEDLGRIVDLMHTMRYTEARLHVREELPFYTGRMVEDLNELVQTLP